MIIIIMDEAFFSLKSKQNKMMINDIMNSMTENKPIVCTIY